MPSPSYSLKSIKTPYLVSSIFFECNRQRGVGNRRLVDFSLSNDSPRRLRVHGRFRKVDGPKERWAGSLPKVNTGDRGKQSRPPLQFKTCLLFTCTNAVSLLLVAQASQYLLSLSAVLYEFQLGVELNTDKRKGSNTQSLIKSMLYWGQQKGRIHVVLYVRTSSLKLHRNCTITCSLLGNFSTPG
jgi:hypothetical protein